MARVTVEDCLRNVKNRFELVMIAAKRARQLMRGKEAHVEWDNDKPTVVALREIAAGFTDFDHHEHHDHDIQEKQFIAGIQQAIDKHEDEKLEAAEATDDADDADDIDDNEHPEDTQEESASTPDKTSDEE